MAVFLAAVLLAPGAPGPSRADLELVNAVEDFVRAAVPTAQPPEPYQHLIVGLGADRFTCRERAGGQLRLAGDTEAIRWLLWGRHDLDPEIRLRSNNLLRDLTRCDMCRGSGLCRVFRGFEGADNGLCQNCGLWGWNHGDQPGPCRPCGGIGSAWPKGPFE